MGIAPRTKASLVSARELPGIVEEAIKAAAVRGGPTGKIVRRWEIVGRVARNFEQGQQFATAVSDKLGSAGFKTSPAVLQIGKDIICGFIERGNLPQGHEF